MPGSRPRIYWDANCFIAYIQGEAAWLPILRTLLEDANVHGSIEIVTSVLSMTEVAFGAMERVSRVLNPEEEARIDRFWSNSAGIKIIEYNERVARYARERSGAKTWCVDGKATARLTSSTSLLPVISQCRSNKRLPTFQSGCPIALVSRPYCRAIGEHPRLAALFERHWVISVPWKYR